MTFLSLILSLMLQAESPHPEEKARVEYVLVEVVARDRQRRLVTDLRLEDFSVRDDGRKVELESLDLLDLRVAPEAPATAGQVVLPSSDIPRLRRNQIILAVDFEFTRYDEAMETFRQLETYFEATEVIEDVVYLVYSLERGALTDGFTPDLRGVLPLLADYRQAYQERRRQRSDDGIGEGDISDLEREFSVCGETNFDRLGLWNCIQQELAIFLEGQYARTLTVIRELEDLMRKFPDPGSLKTIAFISPGFSVKPGRAAVRLSQIYFPWDRPVPVPDIHRPPGESRARVVLPPPILESFTDEFVGLLAVCAQHHVVFQTFDVFHFGMEERRRSSARLPRGNDIVVDAYKLYRTEVDEGMRDLAGETGGEFHGGSSLKHMRPVLEGDRFVYVLGYRTPEGKEGKFRRIKVKCKRAGVKLQHRTGYVR